MKKKKKEMMAKEKRKERKKDEGRETKRSKVITRTGRIKKSKCMKARAILVKTPYPELTRHSLKHSKK